MPRTAFLSIFLISLLTLVACVSGNRVEREIEAIPVDLEIERFDQFFGAAQPQDLPRMKTAYPFMFSKRYPDSIWVARMQDSLQKQIHAEVNKAFGKFLEQEDEITQLFQHLKYYDKTFSVPRVITVTNDVDYRNKVIVTDTIVLIALDNYLGSDHEFYSGIQHYLRTNFKPGQIVVDLADAYGREKIFLKRRRNFLDDMINAGKVLYFKDLMIPFKSDAEKITYTDEQLQWAKENESNIWRHFVEHELLFSTDPKLAGRFIDPAPFSKFGLELDNESPGRLGQYIGWQIVKAYMKNNSVDYTEMLQTKAETIFNQSKYKPPK